MKRYDFKSKKEAVELSYKIGCTKASEQLGIGIASLSRWRKEMEEYQKKKLSEVQKPLDPESELANNSYVSFQTTTEEQREFRRGEVYYIYKGVTTGSEIATGRPAVIVSNQSINNYKYTVEVVYLTTRVKPMQSEHVTIRASKTISTALCEQISTIDVDRIGDKMGECTPEEMEKIDAALLASLGLNKYSVAYASSDKVLARVSTIISERDAYKEICNRLMQK